uniref:Limbic system-associated membrane protein-like isoform X1 n=2 Tax=Crassostrea virginica TaxID=6565 RepID=A0A8B8E2R5_CRAVI|nr:limbic system-associated membrane protein-like isoform X1 [Crassostrea virginica]
MTCFNKNSTMLVTKIPFLLIGSIVCASDYATSKHMLTTFDSSPENVSAIAGKTAILPCTVDLSNLDPTKEITWMSPKNILISIGDRRIIDDTRMSIERPQIPDWNLHIRELEPYDRGIYICSLNTRPMMTKNVYLEVYVTPIISSEKENTHQNLREGETANLTCNATGFPEPTITWYRVSEMDKEAIGRQGSYLMIHNITRYCGGTYTCHAFNGIGPAVSKVFSINVYFQPEVQVLNKRQQQDTGKETILQCEISASPQAIVNWRKGEHVFSANNYQRITPEIYKKDIYTTVLLLRIQNLTWSDFGEYVCEASNSLGRDLETMHLYPINGIHVTAKPASSISDSNTFIFNFSSGNGKVPFPSEVSPIVQIKLSKSTGLNYDDQEAEGTASTVHTQRSVIMVTVFLVAFHVRYL